MEALPQTQRLIGEQGANLTQFRVNSPVCCPSRMTILTGRLEHNNAVNRFRDWGESCQWTNTSIDNWELGLFKQLKDGGYRTGVFGKVYNNVRPYNHGQCASGVVPSHFGRCPSLAPGVDVQMVMQGAYYNYRMHMGTHYLDFGASPSDYSTSVIGNASVEWIRQELNVSGASEFRQPLFGWIGLWAPHADFTPAPWHADHPIGLRAVPRDARFNYRATDKHPIVAQLSPASATHADWIHGQRLRTLLSVDDLVVAVHDELATHDELRHTFLVFTSDNGFNLGQFRSIAARART